MPLKCGATESGNMLSVLVVAIPGVIEVRAGYDDNELTARLVGFEVFDVFAKATAAYFLE